MSDWFQRIAEVERRAAELEQRLADPALARAPGELARLAKQLGALRPLLDAGRRYRATLADLTGAREMLAESDDELRALAEAEVPALEERRAALEREIRLLLVPVDPTDAKSAILEIRAGTGGEEAALFAADLFRMYTRYAEPRGWKVELLSISESGTGGLREVIAGVSGKDVFGRLKYEKGVHRVQRVPATEGQGRIHTSTVTVAILPEAEEVDVEIDPSDLRVDVFRASGPGGQSVNTTDSAVRITHLPTGLVVSCQDEKSQHKNRAKAMKVLRSRLLEAEIARRDAERASERRAQVGSGERAEKIRTYNFPQNRVTDHRAGVTLHRLEALMEGELDELLDAVRAHMAERQEAAARPGPGGSARGEAA
jgi:peptide chain release factor 1